MVFSSFPADVTGADAPDAEEVRHRQQGERDVSADHEHGDEERTPDVEVPHRKEGILTDGRSEHPQQPAGDDEHHDGSGEEQVRSFLAGVVAALRRNLNRTERDLEEATRVAAEVAEPQDRVLIPDQAGIDHQRKAFGGEQEIAHEVEREDDAEADVPSHEAFTRSSFGLAEVDDSAGNDERKPKNCVKTVEDLIGNMEAQNAVVVIGHDCDLL